MIKVIIYSQILRYYWGSKHTILPIFLNGDHGTPTLDLQMIINLEITCWHIVLHYSTVRITGLSPFKHIFESDIQYL